MVVMAVDTTTPASKREKFCVILCGNNFKWVSGSKYMVTGGLNFKNDDHSNILNNNDNYDE